MYAVLESGNKQFKVQAGDLLEVEQFESPAVGEDVVLNHVLMVRDEDQTHVGHPYVEHASVRCEVLGPSTGPKLVVFKYRRRKDSKTRRGHRQHYVRLQVKDIDLKA